MASYNDFKVGLGVGFNTTNSQLQAELDKYAKNLKVDAKIGVDYTKAQADAKEAATKIQTILQSAYKDATGKDLANSDAKRFTTKYLKEYISQINVATTASNKLVTEQKRIAAADSLKRWSTSNSAAMKQFGSQVNDIMTKLRTNTNMTGAEFNDLQTDITKLKLAARDANKIGFSFTDKLKNGLSKFSMWFGTTAIFMRSIQAIKGMWNEVVELDTSLVDLQKTTSMTSAELEEFYTRSNTIAKQMGVSTTEIINQASAWSRLGYSTAEASEQMAKLSSQFASISPGMDVDTATDGLVSIMKAFDIDPSNVLDGIMSKVNAIGNTAATSNSEIVDMLERSSSAMASANNTLEQTIALGTSAVEVTRDAAGVGTALKTISMRIRAMDEETGQYDETLGGIVGKIHDLTGVSIMSDTDTYRSTYDILEDISKVWDNLTDKQRAQTLEELFGKRQANVGSAILTNFDAATKAMDTMADSAGSADKEMGIIMDSLEYKINAFKETETGIAQNLFQKDDMKALVDALTKVGEAIEFVTDKLGLFGTIGLGASLFAGIKNVGRGKIVSSRPICLR